MKLREYLESIQLTNRLISDNLIKLIDGNSIDELILRVGRVDVAYPG